MKRRFSIGLAVLVPLGLLSVMAAPGWADEKHPGQGEIVPYEPTPLVVVEAMLKLAGTNKDSVVFDLGSGDGRIVIMAVKKFGAKAGTGIDLDPQRDKEAKDLATADGVLDKCTFIQGDIRDADLRPATVVTAYLLNTVNLLIRPKLFADLRAGTPVVTHAFHMADWEPDKIEHHPKARGNIIYLWIMPARIGGIWKWTTKAGGQDVACTLRIDQEFQAVRGMLTVGSEKAVPVTAANLTGKQISFAATVKAGGQDVKMTFQGVAEDAGTITGTQEWTGGASAGKYPWEAKRDASVPDGTWQVSVPTHQELNGVIRIDRREHRLAAYYTSDAEKREVPLPALYVWGASIRFELPSADGNPLVFTGFVDGDKADGILTSEGWSSEQKWSGKRTKGPATQPAAGPAAAAPAAAPPAAPPPQARKWNPSMGAPQAGDEYINAKDGSVMVWIPSGEFIMGRDDGPEDEKPAHKQAVPGFWMGRYEVTNAQYRKFMDANPVRPPMFWEDANYNQPDQPVVGVTWMEDKAYCDWAGLRMPTECEWEYAAAGGKQLKYPTATGEISHDLANIRGTGGKDKWEYTSPVGSFPPNPFGLYDMAGNGWDFTFTRFASYPYSATDGREVDQRGSLRELRGGCWFYPAEYCLTTQRHRFASHLRYDYPSIRVALSKVEAAVAPGK